MRALLPIVALVALGASGCLRHGTCAEEPDNRFCRDAGRTARDAGDGPDAGGILDAGGPDAGGVLDAGPADAAVDRCDPACGGATPVCVDGTTCVECTTEDASACEGATPVCDPGRNVCVGCVADTDCDRDAPVCRGGVCGDCTDSSQCRFGDAGICDLASGGCVECTAVDRTACGARSCRRDLRCSDYEDGTQGLCMPCDVDSNCSGGRLCAPMDYAGSLRPLRYCLAPFDAGCSSPQPLFVQSPVRTSASGTATAFCTFDEQTTTCEAYLALTSSATCGAAVDAGPTDGGTACPTGGVCDTVSGTPNRCSYPCDAPSDCPSSGYGSGCDGVCGG